jgi:shikimate kinase
MLGFDYGDIEAVYRLAGPLSTTPRGTARAMNHPFNLDDGKSIALVGLMGAGKSNVGTRLAKRLDMPFQDADAEIVKAAGCTIEDIFTVYGETAFREGERRVITRLLVGKPQVLATGGGAFMDPETRQVIKSHAISVWLRADLDVLVERTSRRDDRPLLKNGDPRQILEALMTERYPIYAEADIVVDTGEEPQDYTVDRIVEALVEATETTS